MTITAETLITVTPHELVGAFYQIVSGESAADRPWPLLPMIVDPEFRMYASLTTPTGEEWVGQWTLDEFIEQHREEYAATGYWRRRIGYDEFVFGNIANALSSFELVVGEPDNPPSLRGIDSVLLLRREARWRILSIAFQVEHDDMTIPQELLTPPNAQD